MEKLIYVIWRIEQIKQTSKEPRETEEWFIDVCIWGIVGDRCIDIKGRYR